MPKIIFYAFIVSAIILNSAVFVCGQKTRPPGLMAPPSAEEIERQQALQVLVDKIAVDIIKKYGAKGFKAENLAITLVDTRDAQKPNIGSFNGQEKIYPASVVKMFYLAAVHRWLQDGKLKDSPELRRGMKDMIVDSSNDATHFIVDVLSGVSSGGELSEKELKLWAYKRNAVNRYFASLGFTNINVCQKTYCEDIYGRDKQFRGKDGINRNMLTTFATAALLTKIAQGKMVSASRSKEMMDLMKRDFEAKGKGDPDDQAHGFTAGALKPGMKLWSKAGWTSTTRHDAAYVETPEGLKFVLVVFTTNFANERDIIPDIARAVLEGMK